MTECFKIDRNRLKNGKNKKKKKNVTNVTIPESFRMVAFLIFV